MVKKKKKSGGSIWLDVNPKSSFYSFLRKEWTKEEKGIIVSISRKCPFSIIYYFHKIIKVNVSFI